MMPLTSRLLLALLMAVTTAACLGPDIGDDDVDPVRAAVEREVPGARVVEAKVNKGLGNCCPLDLVAETEPADPASARRLTRQIARTVWQNLPDGVGWFTVANKVGGPDCGPAGSAQCWTDFLTVSDAVAPWLWAPPGDPARQQPTSVSELTEQSCPPGPDLDVPGFRWDRLKGFLPDVRTEVRVDRGFDEARLREGAQGIAEFVWNCYPAPLSSLTLVLQETFSVTATPAPPAPTDLRRPEFRFTADELRQRFGPRPDGLPQ